MNCLLFTLREFNQIGALWTGEWKKDILVPFKEQARPMEKENVIWFTYT
jgi:hypothetical protein